MCVSLFICLYKNSLKLTAIKTASRDAKGLQMRANLGPQQEMNCGFVTQKQSVVWRKVQYMQVPIKILNILHLYYGS